MSGNKGIVLLSVVMILLTIAIIGASLVAYVSSVNLSARTVCDEAKALYLAEAGIAHAVHMLRTQAGVGGKLDNSFGLVSLGEGTYTVQINFAQSLITSKGYVRDSKKTVQLQYSAL